MTEGWNGDTPRAQLPDYDDEITTPQMEVIREMSAAARARGIIRVAAAQLRNDLRGADQMGAVIFLTTTQARQILTALDAAQAIEARSGQTEGLDPKGESAVAKPCAPNIAEGDHHG